MFLVEKYTKNFCDSCYINKTYLAYFISQEEICSEPRDLPPSVS